MIRITFCLTACSIFLVLLSYLRAFQKRRGTESFFLCSSRFRTYSFSSNLSFQYHYEPAPLTLGSSPITSWRFIHDPATFFALAASPLDFDPQGSSLYPFPLSHTISFDIQSPLAYKNRLPHCLQICILHKLKSKPGTYHLLPFYTVTYPTLP